MLCALARGPLGKRASCLHVGCIFQQCAFAPPCSWIPQEHAAVPQEGPAPAAVLLLPLPQQLLQRPGRSLRRGGQVPAAPDRPAQANYPRG